MGEDIDLSAPAPAVITNRSILKIMALLVGIGTITGWIVAGPAAGGGVLVGGLIGFVNYLWLDRSTKAMFTSPDLYSSGVLAFMYVLRYLVIAAILFAIYWTDVLPVVAVIAGLSAFAAAVVLQGLRNIFRSST